MKFIGIIIVISFLSTLMSAQCSFTIHTKSKKITIDSCKKQVSLEVETLTYVYNLNSWNKDKKYKLDTFFYKKIIIKNKKHTIYIYPNFSKKSHYIYLNTKNKSNNEKDSIINDVLLNRYNRHSNHRVYTKYFKISPMRFFDQKYLYFDMEDVRIHINKNKEKHFHAEWSRIFVIDDTFYEFDILNNKQYGKRYLQSKAAVYCAFNCLVHEVNIIED